MESFYKSRLYYSSTKEFKSYCPKCQHEDCIYCHCENCSDARQEKENERIKEIKELALKFFEKKKNNPIELETLGLIDLTYLGATISAGISEDFKIIKPAYEFSEPLTPSEEFTADVLMHLYKKSIILIHPDSSIEILDYLYEKGLFPPLEVFWDVNLKANERDRFEIITSLINPEKVNDENIDEAIKLWRNIALAECIQYLIVDIENNLKYMFDVGEETIAIFSDLLTKFSTAQVFGIIQHGTDKAVRSINEEGVNKINSVNFFIEKYQSYAEYAISKGYDLENYSRKRECPQSVLSKFIYNKVLKIGSEGFTLITSKGILLNK